MTKLSAAQIREAHAQYITGREKVETIARRYGVTGTAFYYGFKRLGLPRRPRGIINRVELTADQLTTAARLLDDGSTLADVADRLCVSIPVLTGRLHEAGYQTYRRRKRAFGGVQ